MILLAICQLLIALSAVQGFVPSSGFRRSSALWVAVAPNSQLAQLASMTTLSIDSGDLKVIAEYAATGYITDATTNPLFVSQAGLSGDPVYASMVNRAVEYAVKSEETETEDDIVALAIDRLSVNLGKAISDLVPGYISTEGTKIA